MTDTRYMLLYLAGVVFLVVGMFVGGYGYGLLLGQAEIDQIRRDADDKAHLLVLRAREETQEAQGLAATLARRVEDLERDLAARPQLGPLVGCQTYLLPTEHECTWQVRQVPTPQPPERIR